MNKIIKFPDILTLQKQSVTLRQLFSALINSRIDAEQQYAKGLYKAILKVQGYEDLEKPFNKIVKEMRKNLFERMEHVKNYTDSLQSEKEYLQSSLQKGEEKLLKTIKEVKSYEKELNKIAQNLKREKAKVEEEIKEIDEGIILYQVGRLHDPTNKESVLLLEEQSQKKKNFNELAKEFETRCESLRKKVKKREKLLNEEHANLKNEYVDWVKRIMVEEVSFVRNIQYDIDSMIKESEVFEVQPYRKKQFLFVKEFSALTQINLKISDPYERVKHRILQNGVEGMKNNFIIELNEENIEEVLTQLQTEYSIAKEPVLKYIESFRLKNIFKFQKQPFESLVKIFTLVFEASYRQMDLITMNKLIMYASSYYCEKKSVLEMMKKEPFFSDSHLWKFLILTSVKEKVDKCEKLQEKEIHTRNNVFSSLVSSSIQMIGFGIEKQEVKNLIVKMGKSFELGERQINDLMKFIDESVKKKNQ